MKIWLRHVASLLIVAIIIFFSGNSVFVHTHDINGVRVVHSHPFSPGAHHTHSDQALQLIAYANQAVHNVDCAPAFTVWLQSPVLWTHISVKPESTPKKIDGICHLLRGPPSGNITGK